MTEDRLLLKTPTIYALITNIIFSSCNRKIFTIFGYTQIFNHHENDKNTTVNSRTFICIVQSGI